MAVPYKDMMVRIAEIEIDPFYLDDYKALLAEQIKASVQLEPGVIFLHGVSLKERPNAVRVFECYANRASYESHIITPHFLRYKSATLHMVTSLTLLETDPISLGFKPA
jgi:quinol monooxygenase YgiN